MSLGPGLIRELLEVEGIGNYAQFALWAEKRKRGNESRYSTLVRNFGEINADRIMRALEVASWDLPNP